MYKILEKLYEGIDLYKIYIIIFKGREILFGNRRNVSNYRPISLGTSSLFEKLLGKVKYKKKLEPLLERGISFLFSVWLWEILVYLKDAVSVIDIYISFKRKSFFSYYIS